MFADKEIEVWTKGEQVHLGGGVYADGEPSLLYKDKVDIQPYSSAEAKKDYGFDVQTTHAMFMNKNDIEIGRTIVKYNGNDYEVKQKIKWDDYVEVLLERL